MTGSTAGCCSRGEKGGNEDKYFCNCVRSTGLLFCIILCGCALFSFVDGLSTAILTPGREKQSTDINDVSLSRFHCPNVRGVSQKRFSMSSPISIPLFLLFFASSPISIRSAGGWRCLQGEIGRWRNFDRGQPEHKRGRKRRSLSLCLFDSSNAILSIISPSVRLTAAILKQPPRGSTGGLHDVE